MSKILITGSAGFLGYHLMTQLGASNDVVGIDNFMHASSAPHKNVKYGDVRYYRDIEDYIKWADEVYHLAAQIHVDKSGKKPHINFFSRNLQDMSHMFPDLTKAFADL
ncbi:hypothetical protein LCGC14_1872220, partial [marine sediment metagenome]